MIADLRERITIERPVGLPDGGGGHERAFAPLAQRPYVWARIEPLAGRELFAHGALVGKVTHRITIRFREDIEAGDRVLWRGRALEIKSPAFDRDERRWLITFLAEETSAA